MTKVVGRLRLELAATGDAVDETVQARGLAWKAALQQPYGHPRSLDQQIARLLAASLGVADGLPRDAAVALYDDLSARLALECPEELSRLRTGGALTDADRVTLEDTILRLSA
mmetsp:Transcript_6351/g.11289  ORF Transcript_6351/g.11289 Transcript_6351/m.11289 type:complete len:113 (-) Transcript_6351:165-503(-)